MSCSFVPALIPFVGTPSQCLYFSLGRIPLLEWVTRLQHPCWPPVSSAGPTEFFWPRWPWISFQEPGVSVKVQWQNTLFNTKYVFIHRNTTNRGRGSKQQKAYTYVLQHKPYLANVPCPRQSAPSHLVSPSLSPSWIDRQSLTYFKVPFFVLEHLNLVSLVYASPQVGRRQTCSSGVVILSCHIEQC